MAPVGAAASLKYDPQVTQMKALPLYAVADPYRWRRAGSGWNACSELLDDLVTLKVRLDYASPPGAALVRQLRTTAVGDNQPAIVGPRRAFVLRLPVGCTMDG
ncbi:hypothetical protein Bbelb_236250 [Branchiostoma belcheri]|nr:hypothetical protein Bbelb_236250 [Branchiostoma belcheri]